MNHDNFLFAESRVSYSVDDRVMVHHTAYHTHTIIIVRYDTR